MLTWIEEKHGNGIEELDLQHKELFDRINNLQTSIADGKKTKAELWHTIDFMVDYVKEHFEFEEKIMAERKCSALEDNMKAHSHFLAEFQAFRQHFDQKGTDGSLSLPIVKQAEEFIQNHISTIDARLRKTT